MGCATSVQTKRPAPVDSGPSTVQNSPQESPLLALIGLSQTDHVSYGFHLVYSPDQARLSTVPTETSAVWIKSKETKVIGFRDPKKFQVGIGSMKATQVDADIEYCCKVALSRLGQKVQCSPSLVMIFVPEGEGALTRAVAEKVFGVGATVLVLEKASGVKNAATAPKVFPDEDWIVVVALQTGKSWYRLRSVENMRQTQGIFPSERNFLGSAGSVIPESSSTLVPRDRSTSIDSSKAPSIMQQRVIKRSTKIASVAFVSAALLFCTSEDMNIVRSCKSVVSQEKMVIVSSPRAVAAALGPHANINSTVSVLSAIDSECYPLPLKGESTWYLLVQVLSPRNVHAMAPQAMPLALELLSTIVQRCASLCRGAVVLDEYGKHHVVFPSALNALSCAMALTNEIKMASWPSAVVGSVKKMWTDVDFPVTIVTMETRSEWDPEDLHSPGSVLAKHVMHKARQVGRVGRPGRLYTTQGTIDNCKTDIKDKVILKELRDDIVEVEFETKKSPSLNLSSRPSASYGSMLTSAANSGSTRHLSL